MKKLLFLLLLIGSPSLSLAAGNVTMTQGSGGGNVTINIATNAAVNTTSLPSGDAHYIQNTLSPTTTTQAFSVQTASAVTAFVSSMSVTGNRNLFLNGLPGAAGRSRLYFDFTQMPRNSGFGPQSQNVTLFMESNLDVATPGGLILQVSTGSISDTGADPASILLVPTTSLSSGTVSIIPAKDLITALFSPTETNFYGARPLRLWDEANFLYTDIQSSPTIPSLFKTVLPSVPGTTGQVLTVSNVDGSTIYEKWSDKISVSEIDDPASVAKINFESGQPAFYAGNMLTDPLASDGFWGSVSAGLDIEAYGGNGNAMVTDGAIGFVSLQDTFTYITHDRVTILASTGMAVASSYVLKLPRANGIGNFYNDGTGQLSFVASSGGGGGGYSLEPATVTARFNSGMTASTTTINIGGSRVAVFTATGCAIRGVQDNSLANSMDIGYSTKCVSPETQFTASNAYKDFCQITISSGDWEIIGLFYFENGGGTNAKVGGGISIYPGDDGTSLTGGDNYLEGPPPTSVYQNSFTLPYHVHLNSSTTYYQKGLTSYTSTAMYFRGSIEATRKR